MEHLGKKDTRSRLDQDTSKITSSYPVSTHMRELDGISL